MAIPVTFSILSCAALFVALYAAWRALKLYSFVKKAHLDALQSYTEAGNAHEEATRICKEASRMYMEAKESYQKAYAYAKQVSVLGEGLGKLWVGVFEYGGRGFFATPAGREQVQRMQRACQELRNLSPHGDWEDMLLWFTKLSE